MLHVHNCLVWKRDEGWQGVLSFGGRGGEHFGHYGGSGGGVFILFMESGCCGGGGDQSLNQFPLTVSSLVGGSLST